MSERIRTSYEDMVKNYSAVGLKFKEQGDGYMVFHGFLPEGIEVQVGFFNRKSFTFKNEELFTIEQLEPDYIRIKKDDETITEWVDSYYA